jgi:hypothetical protein
MDSASDLLIFKMRGVTQPVPEQQTVAQKAPINVQPQPQVAPTKPKRIVSPIKKQTFEEERAQSSSIYHKEGEDYPNPLSFYKEAIAQNQVTPAAVQSTAAPRGRADSKAKAKDLFCVAHQFRHAYAICSYCHRPFCYEDLVEYQKGYYCIEDIDRATTEYTESLANEYSVSSLITSFLLIGAFVLYLYYSNGSLIYTFDYIFYNLVGFFNAINMSYIVILSTLIVMAVSFVGAFYILLGSKQGHLIASVVSVVAVMLFIYQYIGSGSIYYVIIAAFEFVAFLSAIRSAAAEAQAYSQVYERGPEYGLAYGYGAKY